MIISLKLFNIIFAFLEGAGGGIIPRENKFSSFSLPLFALPRFPTMLPHIVVSQIFSCLIC